MRTNTLEKLHFRFNRCNESGMRRLRRLLRSSGYENSVFEKATLEIRKLDASPMDIALRVASLAYFAFEMDVCYRKIITKDGVRGFAVDLC